MVLVSHTHKLIFLKTRKTAGTSVEMLLEAATGLGPTPPQESRHADATDAGIVGFRMLPRPAMTDLDRAWKPHTPAATLRDVLGDEIWDSYLKVACVRNPFDRVISDFHWRESLAQPALRTGSVEGFADFVRGKWQNDENVVMIDDIFVPDMLIRYEKLSHDLAQLADRTGLTLDPKALPRTKVRRIHRLGEIATYYTEELAQIVRTRLAWVFAHVGYAPELPRPHMQGAR